MHASWDQLWPGPEGAKTNNHCYACAHSLTQWLGWIANAVEKTQLQTRKACVCLAYYWSPVQFTKSCLIKVSALEKRTACLNRQKQVCGFLSSFAHLDVLPVLIWQRLVLLFEIVFEKQACALPYLLGSKCNSRRMIAAVTDTDAAAQKRTDRAAGPSKSGRHLYWQRIAL